MGVSVYVHDDHVTVDFEGLDRVMALKSHVEVAMADIVDARVASQAELRRELGWRLGGGYWPGWFATGHFSTKGGESGRQLWDCYRDADVLLVETRLDDPWRIVLQHPDRERLAWLIAERLGR